jgi:hypothetical protein
MVDYKFIVSPENVQRDLNVVTWRGEQVGVYSAMTQILTGNTNNTSLLTGLTLNVLLTQTATDAGYYSEFDGAILQKDVVANFIFSAVTGSPYTYYIYNTSDEFQKFLELSKYTVDWGDGSPLQEITAYTPTAISHSYPVAQKTYKITMEQVNPWGLTRVQKTITTPFKDVKIYNLQGECYFIPKFGNWFNTPISYNYIFTGDSLNVVSNQTSNNFTTVPFTVSGTTKSRLEELALYSQPRFMVGVPVVKNGQIWGAVTDINRTFTAYTIQAVNYYDYANGTSIFFQQSSGFTDQNLTAVPITKLEALLKVMDQPQIQSDAFVERGKASAYERVQRLGEVDNLGDMLNYGYGFFNVENKD